MPDAKKTESAEETAPHASEAKHEAKSEPAPDPVVMKFIGPKGWSMPYPPIAGRSYRASEIGAFWDRSLVRHLTEENKVFSILDQRVVDELPNLATHLTSPKPPAPAVDAGKTDEKGA